MNRKDQLVDRIQMFEGLECWIDRLPDFIGTSRVKKFSYIKVLTAIHAL